MLFLRPPVRLPANLLRWHKPPEMQPLLGILSDLLPVVGDMLLHELGDRLPVHLDRPTGAYLLAE